MLCNLFITGVHLLWVFNVIHNPKDGVYMRASCLDNVMILPRKIQLIKLSGVREQVRSGF